MYSLHHLTQSNTVRKELPAGLLPPRQLGFCPQMTEEERKKKLKGWKKAVKCTFEWAKDEEEYK